MRRSLRVHRVFLLSRNPIVQQFAPRVNDLSRKLSPSTHTHTNCFSRSRNPERNLHTSSAAKSRSILRTPSPPSYNVCTTRSRATPTTVNDSTVRHPSDSFETPNSTINCSRRKVFGIEKVSAKLRPPLDADGHLDFRRTYRENPDRTEY